MLFKRSPKLYHSHNLIKANPDGNIVFSEGLPNRITWFIRRIILDNSLYKDDRPYIAVYKEYKAHYVMYDLHPWMLYFRIPVVIASQYIGVTFVEPRDYLIPYSELRYRVPDKFRIPSDVKGLLLNCFNQSRAYIKTIDGQELDDFGDYLEFKFLSEWPEYWNSPGDYTNAFSNGILHRFIRFAGENKQTVKNIIERTIQSNIERASSN